MDVGKIISNSFKYPFRNLKKLPILFVLFILLAIIPIGMFYDNKYVVAFGVFAFFLFILIVPGYLFSFVQFGVNESSMFPSLNFVKNIYNSIRLLILRIVYMIVPAAVFFIVVYTLGGSSIDRITHWDIPSFFLNIILIFLIVLITYIIFEVLLFFAKARMAYLDSLAEALKMHKVIGDIKRIGLKNIFKWLIVMAILMVVVFVVSSWIVMIPYVGFLIYICIVIPILESIGNYSLGLLYSNIAEGTDNLVEFEKEIQLLKYIE